MVVQSSKSVLKVSPNTSCVHTFAVPLCTNMITPTNGVHSTFPCVLAFSSRVRDPTVAKCIFARCGGLLRDFARRSHEPADQGVDHIFNDRPTYFSRTFFDLHGHCLFVSREKQQYGRLAAFACLPCRSFGSPAAYEESRCYDPEPPYCCIHSSF